MGRYDYMNGYELHFRNETQKMLWESELAGQISDGQWENASPMGHYIPWGKAEVTVDPDNVGRNFPVSRDNYNFVNSDFLACVGARMVFRTKFMTLFPEMVEKMGYYYTPEGVNDIREMREYATGSSQAYWNERLEKLAAAGITQEVLDAVEDADCFTMKDLRRELKDMKAIVRTRLF